MASQTSRQTAVETEQRAPAGTIHVVDPNPLNWLFVTWNTMEEPVRTDEKGHIVGAVMEDSRWVDKRTFEVDVRRGVRFQDSEECTAHSVKRAFDEVQRWKAPHPPGTSLNFHPDSKAEVVDNYKVRITFPSRMGWCWASLGAYTSRARDSGRRRASATGSWGAAKATGE